jgi:peptidoglycan/xylan/chitin deacetylase (PgdA/CDA1 family)
MCRENFGHAGGGMGKMILKRLVKRLGGSIFPEATRQNVILTYHSVGSAATFSQPVEYFEQQMALLADEFDIVPLPALVERVEKGAERLAAITFDDGFEDLFTRAFPVLRKRSLPFTVFLATGFIESEPGFFDWSPHYAGLPPLNWHQVQEMIAAGCHVGAHTHSHPRLSACTSEEIAQELSVSKRILEASTGTVVRALAYPFGQPHDYDRRVLALAREAGFDMGFSSLQSCVRSITNRFEIPRICIDANDGPDDFMQKITGRRDFMRWIEYCNSALIRNGVLTNAFPPPPSTAGRTCV